MKKTLSRIPSLALAAAFALLLAFGFLLGGCGASSKDPSGTAGTSATASAAASSDTDSSESGSTATKKGASSSKSSATPGSASPKSSRGAPQGDVVESGEYTDKDSVALYIHLYGHLPSNYISKTKARKAGWDSKEGNLWDVLPGKSIGGSEFYDDEDALPNANGRRWTECDIDYNGGYRNAKRIVFSNDGLIYYTDDHYQTFERLY